MDDEAEELSARNTGKPEGNKKAKEMVKVEGEAASFREKLDQLMKSKEALTMKTLETKPLITEKKMEVKLAMVEARRKDAKLKAELDLRMIALKEAKTMKELLAEERDIMMMRTDGMDEDQLAWWKETKADIMARKKATREARAASAQGHLGELSLAGATMATSFAGFTGFSLLNGLASGLETLCGQAFGARQYHLVCVHKQRGMLILTLLSVPLAVVWFYAGSILLLFGLKDEDIAMEAGTYARWMIPALFAYGLLQCQVRYLQMQNIVFPVMLSAAATVLFHLAVCWVLVHGLGLGSKGVAIGIAISYWINVLILAVYVRVSSSCKNTWTGFSIEAFHDPLVFFRVAVPSALMVCSEWWLFETIILLSGLLPNARLETSVLSITLSTADCLYMIPSGLGAAISTRVSNELGTARPRAARLAVRVAMFFAISEGLVMAMILISVRHVWGHVYSDQEEVVTYVAKMVLLIAVSSVLDGIQSILSGVARGCGWQKIGACINLGAFYIVGIPAAYLFAFVLHIGGMGLWMGIICGILVQDLLLLAITLCTDWEKEATKVKDRVLCSALPTDLAT